jgi:hypothetical protein
MDEWRDFLLPFYPEARAVPYSENLQIVLLLYGT